MKFATNELPESTYTRVHTTAENMCRTLAIRPITLDGCGLPSLASS